MLEKFKQNQSIAYKIISNTLNNKHYAHAYLIETNNCTEGFDFAAMPVINPIIRDCAILSKSG